MKHFLSRLISRDLQDVSNDDVNSYEETQGLLNTLYINSIIFAVFLTFYEMNRHMRSIYLKRLTTKFKKSNRVPAAPSKYPFAWIVRVMCISDDDLLRMVGLDGYMLVRYINVCFKMSMFLTLWGLVVLVPVYSSAQDKHFSWNKYTLANIPNDPSAHQLWVPAIFAYIFSTYFCHLMYGEYRNFVKKRIQYLIQGDPDTPPQTYYTLMVEKVPINLRSAPALEAFFENMFPGDVHSVEVALDLKELDMMTKHRRHIRDSLEKAIALSKATGRQQLQWIRNDFYENSYPLKAMKENRIAKLCGFIVVDAIEHRTRVLAELNSVVRILQLATFEKRHIVDQQETKRQQNIHGKIEAHVGKKVRKFLKASISTFVTERDKTFSAAKSCLTACQPKLEPDIQDDTKHGLGENKSTSLLRGDSFLPALTPPSLLPPPPKTVQVLDDANNLCDESALEPRESLNALSSIDSSLFDSIPEEKVGDQPGIEGGDEGIGDDMMLVEGGLLSSGKIGAKSEDDEGDMVLSPYTSPKGGHSPVHQTALAPPLDNSSVDPLFFPRSVKEKEHMLSRLKLHRLKRRKWRIIGAMQHFAELFKLFWLGLIRFAKEAWAITVTGIRWVLRSLLEGVRTVELLTVGACYKTSSTAFVTLKSRVAKSSAHQMFLSHVHYSMVVKSAPNPKDCIWENIAIPARQIEMRKTIADCCLIVGAVFWSIVVGFITAIANLESLSKELPWLEAYRNTAIYDVLNQYLAVGVLLILLSILPFLFDIIARSYEGRKLESEIQNSIMTRYFYYQLANVFVSVGLGSIANSIHQIIQNPSSILSILGTSLPTLSVYFTNLLIVKSFTAVPLELLRIWPLICVLSVRSCRDKNKCTIRELKRGAFANPPILYGWIYPNLLMVLMIISTYCCIAPMLVPFGLLFYSFAYLMYKYQLFVGSFDVFFISALSNKY